MATPTHKLRISTHAGQGEIAEPDGGVSASGGRSRVAGDAVTLGPRGASGAFAVAAATRDFGDIQSWGSKLGTYRISYGNPGCV